nr:DUF2934 domain-containing protein [uncultured Rhodopila sp.]
MAPKSATTTNPLEHSPHRDERIREVAYQLWEADGGPHGRDVEYWERARELVGIEESAGAGQLPNPETHPNSARETGIEEASIQQNLGEFPDRLADQGEVQPTPAAKPKAKAAAKAPAKPRAPAKPKKPA